MWQKLRHFKRLSGIRIHYDCIAVNCTKSDDDIYDNLFIRNETLHFADNLLFYFEINAKKFKR